MNNIRRDLNGRAFSDNPLKQKWVDRAVTQEARNSYMLGPSALPPLPIAGARCKLDGTGG